MGLTAPPIFSLMVHFRGENNFTEFDFSPFFNTRNNRSLLLQGRKPQAWGNLKVIDREGTVQLQNKGSVWVLSTPITWYRHWVGPVTPDEASDLPRPITDTLLNPAVEIQAASF